MCPTSTHTQHSTTTATSRVTLALLVVLACTVASEVEAGSAAAAKSPAATAGGTRGPATVRPVHVRPTAAAAAAAADPQPLPTHPVFADPWVGQHVALAYAPETTRDGLGAQALRLLGIYAMSKALGLKYLHAAPQCIGHIGGLPHYQGKECSSRMTAVDRKKLSRVVKALALPSSPGLTSALVKSWQVTRLDDVTLTWEGLVNSTQSALQRQQPMLIKLARVQALLAAHPDVFLALPQLRPVPGGHHQQQQQQQQKPWLLRSIRVAVHMRRGDITQNVRHLNRLLPLRFYINVLKQLTQALEALGHDVVIECYTERPTSRIGRRELATLRHTFPSLNILAGTDDLWNWQQMASADVILNSLSTYGTIPTLLNPNAVIIVPPATGLDGSPMSMLRMRHWLTTLDHNGTLPREVVGQIKQRFGPPGAAVKQNKHQAASKVKTRPKSPLLVKPS